MQKSMLILALTLLAVAADVGDAFAQYRGYGGRGWGGYSGRYYNYPRGYYGLRSDYPYYRGFYPSYYGRYYNWGYTPGYYQNWGYTPRYYYESPQYWVEPSPSTYYYSADASTPATQSFYSGPGTTTSLQPVTVTVTVPVPDAQVWFDNRPTQQQGTERVFQSAPLEPGATYTYTVKAHWNENGRPIEQERQVTVQAGQNVTVDFRGKSSPTLPVPRTAPLE